LAFVTFNRSWKPTGQGPLPTPYHAIFAVGLLYAGLVWFGQLTPFTGLGIDLAQDAAQYPVSPLVAALKFLLTALCIGAGFRGGEVTPLFVIGACLAAAWPTSLRCPSPSAPPSGSSASSPAPAPCRSPAR